MRGGLARAADARAGSDQVAEHIPGCNMAFRREALVAINGFDPQLPQGRRRRGRLLAAAAGGLLDHVRPGGVRLAPSPAEAAGLPAAAGRLRRGRGSLRFKHPDQFNGRGDGKWRGVLYGDSLRGLLLDQAIIYRGTFGSGLFQCIYQPGPAHWAMLPGTLEWQAAAAAVLPFGFFWWPIWILRESCSGSRASWLWYKPLRRVFQHGIVAGVPVS